MRRISRLADPSLRRWGGVECSTGCRPHNICITILPYGGVRSGRVAILPYGGERSGRVYMDVRVHAYMHEHEHKHDHARTWIHGCIRCPFAQFEGGRPSLHTFWIFDEVVASHYCSGIKADTVCKYLILLIQCGRILYS